MKAGMVPNTHFVQEVEVVYKPRRDAGERVQIYSSRDVYSYARRLFENFMLHHEEVWVMMLNSAMKVIGVSQVAKGGITETTVDVRIIFQTALMANATGIILIHNHPAGKLMPSLQDKGLTKKIEDAGKIMDIKLLDHIIVTQDGFFSFADEGFLT